MANRVYEFFKVLFVFAVLALSLIVIIPFILFLSLFILFSLPDLITVTIVNQTSESIALIQIHDMAFKETVRNLNPGEEAEIVMETHCIPTDETYYDVDVEWVSGRKIQRVIGGCSVILSDYADMIITENNIKFLETKSP